MGTKCSGEALVDGNEDCRTMPCTPVQRAFDQEHAETFMRQFYQYLGISDETLTRVLQLTEFRPVQQPAQASKPRLSSRTGRPISNERSSRRERLRA
jgi:hypothetical protein